MLAARLGVDADADYRPRVWVGLLHAAKEAALETLNRSCLAGREVSAEGVMRDVLVAANLMSAPDSTTPTFDRECAWGGIDGPTGPRWTAPADCVPATGSRVSGQHEHEVVRRGDVDALERPRRSRAIRRRRSQEPAYALRRQLTSHSAAPSIGTSPEWVREGATPVGRARTLVLFVRERVRAPIAIVARRPGSYLGEPGSPVAATATPAQCMASRERLRRAAEQLSEHVVGAPIACCVIAQAPGRVLRRALADVPVDPGPVEPQRDAGRSGAMTVRAFGRIPKTTGVVPRSVASARTGRGRGLVTRTHLARSVMVCRSSGR